MRLNPSRIIELIYICHCSPCLFVNSINMWRNQVSLWGCKWTTFQLVYLPVTSETDDWNAVFWDNVVDILEQPYGKKWWKLIQSINQLQSIMCRIRFEALFYIDRSIQTCTTVKKRNHPLFTQISKTLGKIYLFYTMFMLFSAIKLTNARITSWR